MVLLKGCQKPQERCLVSVLLMKLLHAAAAVAWLLLLLLLVCGLDAGMSDAGLQHACYCC
jgi:hypothetical protein